VRIAVSASVFCTVAAAEGASVETRHRTGTDSTAESSPVVNLSCAGIHRGGDWPPEWSTGDSCD
jgi:hypothetical protein